MMCVNAYHKETFVLRKLRSRNTLDFHLVEQQIEIVLDGDDPERKTVSHITHIDYCSSSMVIEYSFTIEV